LNVILLGGFLGSGKTNLLLSLARFLVDQEKLRKEAVVIVENEVGETGIDDRVLKNDGFNVRELLSGCVCCQVTGELVACINEIAEKNNPSWVVVEASGIALPDRILTVLIKRGNNIQLLKEIVIVDAQRWAELFDIVPQLVKPQVEKADILLINKIDLIDSRQLSAVEQSIRKLNSQALIRKVSAKSGVDQAIWQEVVAGG